MENRKAGARGSTPTSDLDEKVDREVEAAKSKAKDIGHDAAEAAKVQAEEGADIVADEVDTIADAARSAARKLEADQSMAMSDSIGSWADGLTSFAAALRDRSADDLVRDAKGIARGNPAGFLLGSIAVGFVAARFAKASASEPQAVKAAGARPNTDTTSPRSASTRGAAYPAGTAYPERNSATDPATTRPAASTEPNRTGGSALSNRPGESR